MGPRTSAPGPAWGPRPPVPGNRPGSPGARCGCRPPGRASGTRRSRAGRCGRSWGTPAGGRRANPRRPRSRPPAAGILLDAHRHPLEADLDVVPADPVEARDLALVRAPEPFQHVLAEAAVQVLGVDGVHRVLLALEPVAGQQGGADLPEDVVDDEQVPAGQQRRGGGAQIAPDQSSQLLHRVGLEPHGFLELVLGGLAGLLDALPGGVVHPAVVGAAQTFLFRNAVPEVHAPVGAALRDQAEASPAVPKQGQRFPEDAGALHRIRGQLLAGGHRVPVAPQQFARGRPGPHPCQSFVLFGAQHVRAIVR